MCLISTEKWLNISMSQTTDGGQRVKAGFPHFFPLLAFLFLATLNLEQQEPQG